MFIEKNGSEFLVYKLKGKKFSVKLSNDGKVLIGDLENLGKKIFDYYLSLDAFKNFTDQFYETKKLEKVLNKNIFLNLYITAVEKKLLFDEKKILSKYQRLTLIFIYESNKTEGSRIPLEEVEKIVKKKKVKYENKNEILEVENSLKAWDFLVNDFIFNKKNLLKLYRILTDGLVLSGGTFYPKGFRKVNVVVGNSSVLEYKKINEEIENLFKWYQENKKKLFSLHLAFLFHFYFERIHPFLDGNGRVGRLLMNKILINNGFIPLVIFSSNRRSYFNAFEKAIEGNMKKFFEFMLLQYEKTLKILL